MRNARIRFWALFCAFCAITAGARAQESPLIETRDDLFGLKLDDAAVPVHCRTVPFLAAPDGQRGVAGQTRRAIDAASETIPVGTAAKTIYLMGLINEGWDNGVAFWTEHPELRAKRDDQLHIGARIGELEIKYAGGACDHVPLVMGATAWYGPMGPLGLEPFASRPDYVATLRARLRLRIDETAAPPDRRLMLAIRPRGEKIESLVVHDNPDLRGRPLVTAVTLAAPDSVQGLHPFGRLRADKNDLAPAVRSARPGDWTQDIAAVAGLIYTRESDLPQTVAPVDFPAGLDAARLRFAGGREAAMLSNIWTANLTQLDRKFIAESGFFRESEPGFPQYGGYMGIGLWGPVGQYATMAFARCSDHFVNLALRTLHNPLRYTTYVDFCDKALYYYRNNRDPKLGPPNNEIDVARYPADAPPHWSFVLNRPMEAVPTSINEIDGNEELDGHGATIVGRWQAWRLAGAPRGDWLTAARPDVYGKSRWDSTRDAAEFICWLMQYTGRDVIYSEGETTGWAGGGVSVPPGMANAKDPAQIRQNYANADMYDPYPSYTCIVGLRCAAQMAEATGDPALAQRWREHADRIQKAMIRLLATGDANNRCWRMSPYSVYPNQMESLVPAWFAPNFDGLDPLRMDPEIMAITRNTLRRQLALPTGHRPLFGFGYGIGWLTQSALLLDEMDDSGILLGNIARYLYDKNMDFSDPARGLDWRPYLWIVPEGVNLLPDGSWHRIGDLSNGANQGITLHALEMCAGIDDTRPEALKILPRAPEPLTGLTVENWIALMPEGAGLAQARIGYTFARPGKQHPAGRFSLTSDRSLPTLAVRLGPFGEADARAAQMALAVPPGATTRVETSGRVRGGPAWWIWVEGMTNVKQVELGAKK